MAADNQLDPSLMARANSSPDEDKWKEAMEEEMESLHSMLSGSWYSKWIFKWKINADGAIERYKAQLAIQG